MKLPNRIKVRQGDVALIPVESTEDATPLPAKNGLHVLAHGEVSGHIHAVRADRAEMLGTAGGLVYLAVAREVELGHGNPGNNWKGDHETRVVPPGKYRSLIERDYTPEGHRQVVD